MKEDIFPSHVVICEHFDQFTKAFIKHPFVVWKRQGFNSKCKNNIYAFRMTTNLKHKDIYNIVINPSEANGLKKRSYVCTDSIFLLDVNGCDVVGQLNTDDFLKVIESRVSVHNEELMEAVHALKNISIYESRNIADKKNDKKLLDK